MQTEMKPWIILITHGKLGAEVKGKRRDDRGRT